MYIFLKMKNVFIYFALFFSSIIVAQFGQGMQQGGMQGRGNQMNQMNQISQPRMEEKKPEPLTSDQILKKMTLIIGLDQLQQLQIRELLLNLPKPIEAKSQAEFDEQQQISEKFNNKLKKILTDDQLEKWRKDKNKATPAEKAETRKERKEREKKQQELLESLK